MNIVVYGMDNSGKTTLQSQLGKELNIPVIHSCGPKDLEQLKQFMSSELESGNKIFDRFPIIEEEIYGRELRGSSKFDNEKFLDVLSYLDKVDLFIYCDPGFDNITKWGEREQMDGVIQDSQKLYDQFIKFNSQLSKIQPGKIITYNYKQSNYKDLLPMIEEK